MKGKLAAEREAIERDAVDRFKAQQLQERIRLRIRQLDSKRAQWDSQRTQLELRLDGGQSRAAASPSVPSPPPTSTPLSLERMQDAVGTDHIGGE